jgi:hypothetical protein
MIPLSILVCLAVGILAACAESSVAPVPAAPRHPADASAPVERKSRPAPAEPVLPPAPAGVNDLKFKDLIRFPVGPLGLEYAEAAKALDGKKVRLLGYMVRQSQPQPWTLLLSPVPLTLHEREYGFAEDLPPTVVHVFTQKHSTPILPWTPGPLLLTGTLSLGPRAEPDGRTSNLRLFLDPPTAAQRQALSAAAGAGPAAPPTLSTNPAPSSVGTPPGKKP